MFLVIEGIDGCGKSTQSLKLSEWLEEKTGKKTIRTFEPGGWENGLSLRQFLLTGQLKSNLAELLLFLADRAEHIERVILPAMREGLNIVCERWNASTIAYQDIPETKRLIDACNFPVPDAVIFLRVSPEIALERIKLRSSKPDKFEDGGLSMLKKISMRYENIITDMNMLALNANGNADDVFSGIVKALEGKLWQYR